MISSPGTAYSAGNADFLIWMPGRRIGVYGMGEIGRKIAARCAAFEAEVGYFSRSKHDVPYQYFPSLEALADWCSVLIIAVRAGPETNHIVNADIFKRLGEEGYVVNIARGSVIDQAALVQALTDKTIAGADRARPAPRPRWMRKTIVTSRRVRESKRYSRYS